MLREALAIRQVAQSVALTGMVQGAIQLLGFIGGLLIVRLLDPAQYAHYTVATTALGAMLVLADSGSASGLLAQAGGVWSDRARLGAVVSTGQVLRRQIATFVAVIAMPVTVLLLVRLGAGWLHAGILAVSVLPMFFLSVKAQSLEVAPRLHQAIGPLQRVQFAASASRIVLLALLLPILPTAVLAALLPALPQAWANRRLRVQASSRADLHMPPDPEVRERLVTLVRRTLPGSLYFAVSGQIAVWLVAVFGDAGAVAAVGALGRLAMILSVIGMVFAVVVVPRFARIPLHESARLRRRFWESQAALATASFAPVAGFALFTGPFVAVLGPDYAGLEREAVLMAAAAAAGGLAGGTYQLGAARGIVARPSVSVPSFVAVQAALAALLPLDSTAGVIWLGLLSSASQWLFHAVYVGLSLGRHRAPEPS